MKCRSFNSALIFYFTGNSDEIGRKLTSSPSPLGFHPETDLFHLPVTLNYEYGGDNMPFIYDHVNAEAMKCPQHAELLKDLTGRLGREPTLRLSHKSNVYMTVPEFDAVERIREYLDREDIENCLVHIGKEDYKVISLRRKSRVKLVLVTGAVALGTFGLALMIRRRLKTES